MFVSFHQLIFIEHLLCDRHKAGPWEALAQLLFSVGFPFISGNQTNDVSTNKFVISARSSSTKKKINREQDKERTL